MKKSLCVILLLIMAIFLVNPSPSLARGGHGGGHWGWWAPWAVIGGADLIAPYYYYGRYYYDPYYYYPPYAPPVVIQEPPPVYVQPAPSAPSVTPPAAEKMFIYPRQGQDEQQQANDRYECHRWAAGQTGYDPTKPPEGLTGPQQTQMRSDYQRAMGACLDGRGYTMR